MHHAHTDRQGDPHTPARRALVVPRRLDSGRHGAETRASRDGALRSDLLKDRYYVWVESLLLRAAYSLALVLLALGGWRVAMWSVFLRVTLGLQATWLVNSATHLWGRRRFERARTRAIVGGIALLTFGEGWHNNHHAHPTRPVTGLEVVRD